MVKGKTYAIGDLSYIEDTLHIITEDMTDAEKVEEYENQIKRTLRWVRYRLDDYLNNLPDVNRETADDFNEFEHLRIC